MHNLKKFEFACIVPFLQVHSLDFCLSRHLHNSLSLTHTLIQCFTTGYTTTIKVQLMNMNWLPNMPMGFSFRVVYDGSGSLYMLRESYEFRTFWTFFRIIGRGHNLSPFAIPLLLKSKSNCLGESESLSLTGIFISWKDTIYVVNRDTAFIFE